MAPTLASALTLSTLGHVSKAFLNFACRDVRVQGLEHLLKALQEPDAPGLTGRAREAVKEDGRGFSASRRSRRRGIITSTCSSQIVAQAHVSLYIVVCNHTSVVDDPLVCQGRNFSCCY